ncbi:hypothetical protein D9M71_471330 [compost metagenome]
MLLQRQCLGQSVCRLPVQAVHQAGVATAGAATVRHIKPRLVEGIEQVAANGHSPTAQAHTDYGHDYSFSKTRNLTAGFMANVPQRRQNYFFTINELSVN